jgi:hypothetical protein
MAINTKIQGTINSIFKPALLSRYSKVIMNLSDQQTIQYDSNIWSMTGDTAADFIRPAAHYILFDRMRDQEIFYKQHTLYK